MTYSLSMDDAIARALEYVRIHELGEDLTVDEVFHLDSLDDEQRKQMEAELGRPFNADERHLFQMHNKSRWVVQFVFQPCPPGETPQGPRVLVNDDGVISHYRPM